MSEFGAYLKGLREAKGYSQRKLAKAIGCSPAHIGRIESEEGFAPSEEVALALAQELGADPDVLTLISGKVTPQLRSILQEHPEAFVQLLRELKSQPKHAVLRVVRVVKDGKW